MIPVGIMLIALVEHVKWDYYLLMRGAYMICMEMYGNGVGTGTEAMRAKHRLIQPEPLPALTAWGAAAAGSAMGGTFVQRTGTTTTPATGTTITASVSSAPEFKKWCQAPCACILEIKVHEMVPGTVFCFNNLTFSSSSYDKI